MNYSHQQPEKQLNCIDYYNFNREKRFYLTTIMICEARRLRYVREVQIERHVISDLVCTEKQNEKISCFFK